MPSNIKRNFVVIGGGTGLSSLLRGLKKLTPDITAIVTVSDDGGSSGALRRELGMLPPGDIRNCLVALSEEETLMSQLFQYRFPKNGGGPLSGHSFGNLFIAAISSVTGGFDTGIERSSKVLAIRGRVLPVTLRSVHLEATLENGRKVSGESSITRANSKIKDLRIIPAAPPAAPRVIEAIKRADAVIVGPGSLYTSIVSNFLVKGIVPALRKFNKKIIYVCNIMTQPGETSGYSLTGHLDALSKYTGRNIFDYAVVNSGRIPAAIAKRYSKENSFPVVIDASRYEGTRIVKADILSHFEYARHDPNKLAEVIDSILTARKK